MAVEPVRIGPFGGGLNTISDPTAIEDVEVSRLVNLEVDPNAGSLVSRPPITVLGATVPGADTTGMNVLGWFSTNVQTHFLIASNRNNATYYFNGAIWVKIADFAATAMTQARDKAWLIARPGSTDVGGSWSPALGFTPEPNMPKGGCAVTHKDRVWIGSTADAAVDGSRLYLSAITTGTVSWPSTPIFLNIGPGDGENLVELATNFDSLILFKQRSTYTYQFSNDPAVGELRKQSSTTGATNKGCVAQFENRIFVVFDNKVYEFTNYSYQELNEKVPLRATNPAATLVEFVSISYWSDRLFVQFYDETYVYALKSGTWSQWESEVVGFMGRMWPIPSEQGDKPRALTYPTTRTGRIGLYQCIDAIGSATEEITCTVVTKNFDYNTSAAFKALKSWGVDVISKVEIEAAALPVTYATDVTWDRLKLGPGGDLPGGGFTWGFLKSSGATWDRLIEPAVTVTDQVATEGSGPGRKYIKFRQALRFRQIGFRIEAKTMGDTATAPFILFNLMTYVADKQKVSKRIS